MVAERGFGLGKQMEQERIRNAEMFTGSNWLETAG